MKRKNKNKKNKKPHHQQSQDSTAAATPDIVYAPGTLATLHGLVSKPHWSGLSVVISGFSRKSGRYAVNADFASGVRNGGQRIAVSHPSGKDVVQLAVLPINLKDFVVRFVAVGGGDWLVGSPLFPVFSWPFLSPPLLSPVRPRLFALASLLVPLFAS